MPQSAASGVDLSAEVRETVNSFTFSASKPPYSTQDSSSRHLTSSMHRLKPSTISRQLPSSLPRSIPRRNFAVAAHQPNSSPQSDPRDPANIPNQPQNTNTTPPNRTNLTEPTSHLAVPKSYTLKNAVVEGQGQCWLDNEVLYLHRSNGTTMKLPYTYLRDFCQCPLCKDEHSHQRPFRTNDIPKDVKPSWVKWTGTTLDIQWANDIPGWPAHHNSHWSIDQLQKPTLDPHVTVRPTKPVTWSGSYMNQEQHWISYEDYVGGGFQFAKAMNQLQTKGLIFIKNIPKSREMVEQIATSMGPLRNSFYGSTFDVRTVPNAQNVAYTNTFLGFHMDLMYMNEPPGYQLLHCLENSCQGGESLFADAFHAAAKMRAKHPHDFKKLSEQRLGYEYRHENSIYYNERPVFELDPRTQEMRHVNYSPPFQSALPPSKGVEQDSSSIHELQDALSIFTSLIEQRDSIFELKLNPGECAIFDNRRIVHARRQFDSTGGSRWLAGAYVDTDALLSCFAVGRTNFPAAWKKPK
ncbi:uncharacterized protein N7511_003579 [Penicillium nucicola]|uniref:uncharacterized protein n=1 Tax=Penicillium nucicola TaxID=1850975 RepID=UPI002545586B|nr:uncharacterized protein N7511_003579 [Penicillium nucicola]KAJ5765963.1 hypothetical protein N7511_003579 [Penicillium nucicola]